MKLEKNKVYTCRINGYDHSSTNDPFYKGEKWEFDCTTGSGEFAKAYFKRPSGIYGRKDTLLIRVDNLTDVFEIESTTFEVDAEFIKAGHASACGEWKEKLESKFPELFPKQTHKVGDRFKYQGTSGISDGEEYILARVAQGNVVLICLNDGNRWSEIVEVRDTNGITEQEFTLITDYKSERFIKVSK
jgi:hypothetical protein